MPPSGMKKVARRNSASGATSAIPTALALSAHRGRCISVVMDVGSRKAGDGRMPAAVLVAN
jgi:hypothetical protein